MNMFHFPLASFLSVSVFSQNQRLIDGRSLTEQTRTSNFR